jgi:nondiscriminating aspartyl-tRNA synthetase
MQRVLIKDIGEFRDKDVTIMGRVINLRKLGNNITFAVVADYTGVIQTVSEKDSSIKMGDAVCVAGKVKKEERAKGGYEVSVDEFKIISTATQEYPIDLSKPTLELQLATLLDNRALSLRHPKIKAIFKLYDLLLEGYEIVMREQGFTEIKTPKLLSAASEGGANFFEVKYFDKKAFLAQSPQLYKQTMVGSLERVFEVGSAFRAEPHFTTRHVNEYISLDAEMGFIDSFLDVTTVLTETLRRVFAHIEKNGGEYLKLYGVEVPKVPDNIPHVKLSEIRKIVKEKYNYEIPETTDIDPEGERLAGRYAKEEFDSDFIYVTHYPWSEKPFYTMQSKDNPEETEGFDLIFKGVEIVTGSQRIHEYEMLIENMKKKNVKPEGLEDYLDIFKYAMPPHGGWGLGSERVIQQLLNLGSIKEAILFPRDVKRLTP